MPDALAAFRTRKLRFIHGINQTLCRIGGLMQMRILVTGGSGFIGTNLVDRLTSRGHKVVNLDVVAPRNSAHVPFWKPGDVLDCSGLRALVRDFVPEVVFHLAARTDLDGRSIADYAANITGVENVILATAGAMGLKRMVFASSRLVCRIGYNPRDELDYCPTTAYGESKVAGERVVRAASSQLGCPWTIVRPTSIWGPWFDIPYKTFFLTIARGQYIHPGTTTILKSFGFVGNTVYQLERLIEAPVAGVNGRVLYLGDYPPTDVTQMANAIQRCMGTKPIRSIPPAVLRPAAWAGDLLKALGWRNPPLTSFRLGNLVTPMLYDLGPLADVVGTLPYSTLEGVELTVNWLRGQGEIP